MGSITLDDILVTPLASIATKSGNVLHAMKQGDVGSVGFGEAYFSWIEAGAVKAWKRHTRMTMNIVVPVGMIRFVFCLDDVQNFRVEEIGENNYVRLTVPPGIWFGFQGLAKPKSLLMDIADIPHEPSEVERYENTDIKFNW